MKNKGEFDFYMKKLFIFILCSVTNVFVWGQKPQKPSEFLGYNLGEAFTPHHKVVAYFNHLDLASERIKLHIYGETYEGRPLIAAIISSPENLKNIEVIRALHLNQTEDSITSKQGQKAIVWLSYNVHGNESSSTEAAMKTIHTIITDYQDWLKDMIVILDPCVNPDGRDRYVQFFNQNKSKPNVYLPNTVEHQEGWPNGRTNHYHFDLNRDWAWLSQKESKARITFYNQWLPHIHIDFHEQGINSNYYFAPAAKPMHKLFSPFQRNFQEVIGKNHARYFDANGWRYFTKEVFDLLYPSYGDTYPTFLGGIGMTYEQPGGGIAGLGILDEKGILLTLKDRILGHFTTGISTLEAVINNKKELLEEYTSFYTREADIQTYIMEGADQALNALEKLLNAHEIETSRLNSKQTLKGYYYQSQKKNSVDFNSNSLIVSTQQPKSSLIQALLEPKTYLEDSLTYDITAWNLPYAYGLKTMVLKGSLENTYPTVSKKKSNDFVKDSYGYVIPFRGLDSSKFLAETLEAQLRPRYTMKKVQLEDTIWPQGSLFFFRNDHVDQTGWEKKLAKKAQENHLIMTPLKTGWAQFGPDMGASALRLIKRPTIALLKDELVDSNAYGETWHFLEQDLNYPLFRYDKKALFHQLQKIDVLLLPMGKYEALFNQEETYQIIKWIEAGGKLITWGTALEWFKDKEPFELEAKIIPEVNIQKLPFDQQDRHEISSSILGSIYPVKLDQSHPLNFGIDRFYTLRQNTSTYKLLSKGSNSAFLNNDVKPLNGFIGSLQKPLQANSLVYGQQSIGNGSVIFFVDNPLFRSFWYQSKIIFSNALFLAF